MDGFGHAISPQLDFYARTVGAFWRLAGCPNFYEVRLGLGASFLNRDAKAGGSQPLPLGAGPIAALVRPRHQLEFSEPPVESAGHGPGMAGRAVPEDRGLGRVRCQAWSSGRRASNET